MKKFLGLLSASVLGFILMVQNAGASFMGDIAEDIGSGATSEVGEVIAGPIGSIIFYVLAIFLISFVVGTIVMWIGKRRNRA